MTLIAPTIPDSAPAVGQARVEDFPASIAQRLSRPTSERLDFLDGIRGLAAVYVVFGHAIATVWCSMAGRKPMGWASFLDRLPSAHYSVVLFIVLSGYCLMLPALRSPNFNLKGGLRLYFFKRARRILPPYYIALLFCILLGIGPLSRPTGTIWDLSLPVNFRAITSHIFLVHDLTGHDGRIDYPMWSIAVEWQIYFLLPLLLLGWRKCGPITTSLIAAALVWPLAHILRHSTFNGSTIWFVGLFAFGMLAATLVSRHGNLLKRHATLILGVACATALLILARDAWAGEYSRWRNAKWLDFFAGLGALGLLVVVAVDPGSRLRKVLCWRPLVWVGGFSYTLYLIHAPLLQLLYQFGCQRLGLSDYVSFLVLAGPGTLTIVLCSFGWHLWSERPFMSAPLVRNQNGNL